MNEILVDLKISADEYIKQYRRPGYVVTTRARDGRRVRFPAEILRPFVDHQGIAGVFRIRFGSDGKLQQIERFRV